MWNKLKKTEHLHTDKLAHSRLVLLLSIAVLAMILVSVISPIFCHAYTYDINITLDNSSHYAVSSGNFAFNRSNDVFVAADNVLITQQRAFDGNILDIALNSEFVLCLSINGSVKSLSVYRYFDTVTNKFLPQLSKVKIEDPNITQDVINQIVVLSMVGNAFYINSKFFLKELSIQSSSDYQFVGDYSKADNFFVWRETPASPPIAIFQENGILYRNTITSDISYNDVLFQSNVVSSSDMQGDYIFANCESGVYKIDKNSKASVKLSSTTTIPKGDIDACVVNGISYLYFLDNSLDAIVSSKIAIKMYSVTADTLVYVNSFDSEKYTHPATFDTLTAAKIKQLTEMFVSPKNRTLVKTFSSNDIILLLAKKDEFYYATDGKGAFGYVATSNLQLLANSPLDSFGKNAQALHGDSQVFLYPYYGSSEIGKVDIFTVLSVTSFVGVDNNSPSWGWCKVSYLGDDNVVKSGYMPLSSIAPYTSYTPPIVFRQAKIKVDKLGSVVNIHLLPDENSEVLAELTDGAIVNLGQKLDKDSLWTKVQLQNGEGYVKTANLQAEGLTALQIALISVSCIVFVALSTTLILLYVKKKKSTAKY